MPARMPSWKHTTVVIRRLRLSLISRSRTIARPWLSRSAIESRLSSTPARRSGCAADVRGGDLLRGWRGNTELRSLLLGRQRSVLRFRLGSLEFNATEVTVGCAFRLAYYGVRRPRDVRYPFSKPSRAGQKAGRMPRASKHGRAVPPPSQDPPHATVPRAAATVSTASIRGRHLVPGKLELVANYSGAGKPDGGDLDSGAWRPYCQRR